MKLRAEVSPSFSLFATETSTSTGQLLVQQDRMNEEGDGLGEVIQVSFRAICLNYEQSTELLVLSQQLVQALYSHSTPPHLQTSIQQRLQSVSFTPITYKREEAK